jgi:hypothetical protein
VRRAHQRLYRSCHHPWPQIRDYLLGGFARAVRRHRRFVTVAALCFYLPLAGMILLIQWHPELLPDHWGLFGLLVEAARGRRAQAAD